MTTMNADTTAHRITRGVLGDLNREWTAIRATTPDISHWRTHAALTEAETLADIAALAARKGANDAVLAALLRLALGGDDLAARTILQVMLGAVTRLALRTVHHADGDHEEAQARAVAALWSAIRSYPLDRRRRNHADRLSLDVLSALTRDRRQATQHHADGTSTVHREYAMGVGLGQLTGEVFAVIAEEGGLQASGGGHDAGRWLSKDAVARALDSRNHDAGAMTLAPCHDEAGPRRNFWAATASEDFAHACSDEQLIVLLAWGARRGVVSVEDAQLLLRLHSPDDPEQSRTARQLAEQIGMSHAALRQRVSRATRRLSTAVHVTAQSPLDVASTRRVTSSQQAGTAA